MSKFKVGDKVKGTGGGHYSVTNKEMTLGEVLKVSQREIQVKVLEHSNADEVGTAYWVDEQYFELVEDVKMVNFQIGDKVRGITTKYGYTDKRMTLAEVIDIKEYERKIRIKVIKHEKNQAIGNSFWVSAVDFELVAEKGVNPAKTSKIDLEPVVTDGVKIVNKKGFKYLIVDGKYTIAIPEECPVGIAVKDPTDDYHEATGMAFAFQRLYENTTKLVGGR